MKVLTLVLVLLMTACSSYTAPNLFCNELGDVTVLPDGRHVKSCLCIKTYEPYPHDVTCK